MNFRHEWKHEINQSDKLVLEKRLRAVLRPDEHARNGTYKIRSLYFDNQADKALREKLDGIANREKFRLRYYNDDLTYIVLEKKSKRGGVGFKESCVVEQEEVQAILSGNYRWMQTDERALLKELYHKVYTQGLRPKTIVDYTREAFVYPAGNVRVTLDYDIRTGLFGLDFLNPDSSTVPVANNPIILEVKWDNFLPSIVRDTVSLNGRHTAPFSKYAVSRMYD